MWISNVIFYDQLLKNVDFLSDLVLSTSFNSFNSWEHPYKEASIFPYLDGETDT